MKKSLILLACLLSGVVGVGGAFAKEIQPVTFLPAVVAQSAGQANTVIMWHDINDDGKADYKAAYVFKNGKLHRLSKIQIPGIDSVRQINER